MCCWGCEPYCSETRPFLRNSIQLTSRCSSDLDRARRNSPLRNGQHSTASRNVLLRSAVVA